MNMAIDHEFKIVMGIIYGLLFSASLLSCFLKKRITTILGTEAFVNLRQRVHSWWVMMTILLLAIIGGKFSTITLFTLISFLALREFVTMTPTRRADHRTLFWVFFILLPYQYLLVGLEWYGLFSIFIPVYAFLIVPTRSVLRDDYERFLERTAKIQWGLMICVYFVSHIPALFFLEVKGFHHQGEKLLLFLILITQLSDVFQYVTGKYFGKTKIAPQMSPKKTVEGFVWGVLITLLFGFALSWLTPFTRGQAVIVSLIICVTGFFGGLTMSAIKRDRGVKDYGTLIRGHGGMLDRIDSLCFAAPVYFHIIRYYFT